jgi:Tannase and feruloyl esterase
MRGAAKIISALWRPTIFILGFTLLGSAAGNAGTLPVVKAAIGCADLAKIDFSGVDGAPARIDAATEVGAEAGKAAYCKVTGYIASNVRFEVRLPLDAWTQRLLMVGCGGYCGFVGIDNDSVMAQSAGCAPLNSGTMVTAATDLGHEKSASFFPDGLWARGNPGAIVDFAYAGMHKSTLLAKALTKAFYRQGPKYSYYSGCSDGGREGLQEVQRFPEDFDGVVIGAPVIDEVATNTFYHAWGVRANSQPDGLPILTANKMPALIAAVVKACGDQQGLIPDPRACKFDLSTIVCKSGDDDSCLTKAQADVVRKLWDGPVDDQGDRLSAGDMPIGSEAAWTGTMVPKQPDQHMTLDAVGDYQWSYDFPNYMAELGQPTGITNQNIGFDKASFDRLQAYSGLYDPTNPDLSDFAKRGGKLIIWQGWSDSGVSPYISLNYVHAVRAALGADEAAKFLALYMLPGVYHCNLYGGPTASREDFLTPMMSWVEDGDAPGRVVVEYSASKDGKIAAKSRPAYPYPTEIAYSGSGDVNDAASYVRADPKQLYDDRLSWLGLNHYTSTHQLWCDTKDAAVTCAPR